MIVQSKRRALLAMALGLVVFATVANAGPFLAYSLSEAQHRLESSREPQSGIKELGGITRLAGLIHDHRRNDFVIVGQANPGERAMTLDDLVVSLRALMEHDQWPSVSIDKTPDSGQTREQVVRYYGGIENSVLARDLFEADVVLKKLGLGLLPSNVWGLESYFDLSAEHWKRTGKEDATSCRFWFTPSSPSFATPEGVFVIDQLRVGVETELLGATVDGQPRPDLRDLHDDVAGRFAAMMEAAYGELAVAYPEISRLKALYDLVAVAEGLRRLAPRADLSYWLDEYRPRRVHTPQTHELISRREKVSRGQDMREMEIDGGIQLRALILDIQDGDAAALRDLVLLARPEDRSLIWQVPLEGWEVSGYPDVPGADVDSRTPDGADGQKDIEAKIGCTFTKTVGAPGAGHAASGRSHFSHGCAPPPRMPDLGSTNFMRPQGYAQDIGGVLLEGAATIEGDARADFTGGNFALVVEGERAKLSPEAFSRFVTALWAVYYSDQDPGISIDPIAPGADKHLVRYIGRVVNSDLGRVMREADYRMKQWAVGTDRPDVPGFRNVDDLTARHGLRYVGASRRFWFVPEAMRFRQAGDALIFDDGRMRVKTEYRSSGLGGRAEPADEAFASFFTDHYETIAQEYPVYQELFEYAKAVSLAKYLKEQGIPLFWFLMANKDLVMTEDSPGTVDALARGSDHWEGMTIEGGVELTSAASYVYDQEAVQALEAARQSMGWGTRARTTLASSAPPAGSSEPFTFDIAEEPYTVVPQHSLTSGRDRRGIRYQTDLALRRGGRPGLELVRYYNPSHAGVGEFGRGWHLFVPYRISSADEDTVHFAGAVLPKRMTLDHLVTGEKEVLAFSTETYTIAGYVPDDQPNSQIIGLFIMSDASYRLADRLGNEFWFDQAGYLTDMILSEDHHVRFAYQDGFTDDFATDPYHVVADEGGWVDFLNVRIPERMRVQRLSSGTEESLVFSSEGEIAGYVPEDPTRSEYQILALMSDASFRLLDADGNEVAFDPAGGFRDMIPARDRRLLESMSMDDQTITFGYTVGAQGDVLVVEAQLSRGDGPSEPIHVARYEYDREERLWDVEGRRTHLAALR